ncbi:NAD(P)-binding protein [Mollisia scopiformis]|uniref:NAD(P)-binding protein n=1 Tax=Mollisia scopiformis TaxID=149040 RepID=A0A194X5Q2_MOLSC|nr:NAD(P)-binding protein [Mollisia scopiformis]KUJ15404.1 NAD(P)-binding protein [Mollisia scopiformis]
MPEIKSVAIAGGSGTLGRHVLKAFLEADFEVTLLTRTAKADGYDPKVKVQVVDFTSIESLTAALKGIDAVVSTVAVEAQDSQHLLIDASVAAGVKRFIPSEFGSCTTSPEVASLPFYSPVVETRKHLQKQCEIGNLTWTVLACGGFIEFLIGQPALVDLVNHKATLLDGGDNRASSTSLPNIAKAIAVILKKFDATKNKVLKVSEVILTQNRILAIAKKLKPEIEWDITNVESQALLKEALAELAAGKFDMPVIMKLLKGTALGGDRYGGAYDKTDNELLGIKELTEEQLTALIAAKLA